MNSVFWTDLGRMEYGAAWALQHEIVDERKAGGGVDRFLSVEHDPVVTLGRRADEANVLVSRRELARLGIGVYAVERGGDVTYHGPGQLVVYPILDLRHHRKDVGWYTASLLDTLVRTLAVFGIEARARFGERTGVWVGSGPDPSGKIAALGVRIERWVTYHGVALNVDPDLSHFELVVPCGLSDARVVSMAGLLGRSLSVSEVLPVLAGVFGVVFDVTMVRSELLHLEVMA